MIFLRIYTMKVFAFKAESGICMAFLLSVTGIHAAEDYFTSGGKEHEKIISQESCTFRVIYRFWPLIAIPDSTGPKPGQQISAYAFACSDSRFCMRLAIRLDSRLYCADIQKYAVRDAAHVPDSCRNGS